jgi:hypothetical protein
VIELFFCIGLAVTFRGTPCRRCLAIGVGSPLLLADKLCNLGKIVGIDGVSLQQNRRLKGRLISMDYVASK